MEEKKTSPKKVKVEIRRSPNALKIVLIVLIASCTVALVALRWVHNGIQDEIQELKNEAAAVEHANEVLDEKQGQLGSVQSIQDIARDELGLVDPDAIVIDPQ